MEISEGRFREQVPGLTVRDDTFRPNPDKPDACVGKTAAEKNLASPGYAVQMSR
jgi:hypothetical protein